MSSFPVSTTKQDMPNVPGSKRTSAALTDRITEGPTLLDTLAPLVGLLLRGREAAA